MARVAGEQVPAERRVLDPGGGADVEHLGEDAAKAPDVAGVAVVLLQ